MIQFLISLSVVVCSGSEVDQYIRSMTKIKPNWSDDKILSAARRIYGTMKVPKQIANRYVPRSGNWTSDATGILSTDARKKIVYKLQDMYPRASAGQIAARFASGHPLVQNPPSNNRVGGYLFFRNVEETLGHIPDGSSVRRMMNEDRQRIYIQGKARMAKMMSENRELGWEDLVRKTVEDFYDEHEIKLKAETVYRWYLRIRKEQRNGN
jgi:hypothetical protein